MSSPRRLPMRRARRAAASLAALVALASFATGARADLAAHLVDEMRAARASEGFELRFTATPAGPGGADGPVTGGRGDDRTDGPGVDRSGPVKVALVGQLGGPVEHLLVRAIAPARLRDDALLAEQAEGVVHAHARARGAARAGASSPVNPFARLFGTELALWDLLSPWWQWPDQQVVGTDEVEGHACIELLSRAPASVDGAIGEARSCVDAREGLAWRVRLYDRHHRLVRTLLVERAMRTQAGTSTVRRALVTRAGGGATRIEVYAGDEHHRIEPDTFALATVSTASTASAVSAVSTAREAR